MRIAMFGLGIFVFVLTGCGNQQGGQQQRPAEKKEKKEIVGMEKDKQENVTDEDVDAVPTENTNTLTENVVGESGGTESFTADVWADNWFALYVNGQKVGEDSVPITTERSFNKETITFTASRPLTIAIEAKDFKENDTGLEYIGSNRQQMGDGGVIMQIKDDGGSLVGTTGAGWKALVAHTAPLDKGCENSSDPTTDCLSEEVAIPTNWFSKDFDDSAWQDATVHSAAAVDPKMGYDEVSWDAAAEFIWGSDLEQVNTVLLRTVVE